MRDLPGDRTAAGKVAVLPPKPVALADMPAEVLQTCPPCLVAQGFRCPGTSATPHYEFRRLLVGHLVAFAFLRTAWNESKVVETFEREGWPLMITSPLGQSLDTKTRRRLKKTVFLLNDRQKIGLDDGREICLVRFHGHEIDGKISWEYGIPLKGT